MQPKPIHDPIITVGDLLNELCKYDLSAPIRMLCRQGNLDEILKVQEMAGRVVIINLKFEKQK